LIRGIPRQEELFPMHPEELEDERSREDEDVSDRRIL
jgi:hypothetical protein